METNFFKIEDQDKYVLVKLVGMLEFLGAKPFSERMAPYLENTRHVLVDCQSLLSLSTDWTRALVQIQAKLKAKDKSLRLFCANHMIMGQLRKEGLDKALPNFHSQREALDDLGLAPQRTLDTEFINPFLDATMEVLRITTSIEAKPGKMYVHKSAEKFGGDVSGIIGIVAEAFKGSVVISFPEQTFLKVMSGMLGEEIKEMSKDIVDGAGEITNQIFGSAKVILNQKGYGINTAIPSVISGKDHSLSSIGRGMVVVVPFESSAGNFFVQICIAN